MARKDARTLENGKGRTKNWATIVYPESAPDDWMDILGGLKIEVFISPLHDKDVNPGDELKKPHYHVIIMFPSVKTEEQAKEVFEMFGGVGCEYIASIRGYARYLCHLDNPEKHIYDTHEVISFGGADYYSVITLVTDKYITLAGILDFCDEQEIKYYSELIRWCRNNKFEWFRALCDGGSFMVKEYLKTATYERLDSSDEYAEHKHNLEYAAALDTMLEEKRKNEK